MDVTAEGIETAAQLARLQDLACGFGQGYYFHKPFTRADAQALLASDETVRTRLPVVGLP
jgi:EAL domain-containing protein (putative c-di-GMP-specific phosphodiesterase class I)